MNAGGGETAFMAKVLRYSYLYVQSFRSVADQRIFDARGYLEFSCLGRGDVEHLRGVYERIAGAGYRTHEFASRLTYYISTFDTDPEHRATANVEIGRLLEETVERRMLDYRILGCNFMVKAPRGGEIQAHQDFTWVDEDVHTAFNLWIPLQDTSPECGGLHVIPGSHRALAGSFRSSSIPHSLVAYNESLKKLMTPLVVPAGQGILFDHRLLHYSPANQSDEPRIAVQLLLVPREAQPVIAVWDPERKDEVRLLAIEDEYLEKANLWAPPPEGLPVVAVRPYPGLPGEAELLARLKALEA